MPSAYPRGRFYECLSAIHLDYRDRTEALKEIWVVGKGENLVKGSKAELDVYLSHFKISTRPRVKRLASVMAV